MLELHSSHRLIPCIGISNGGLDSDIMMEVRTKLFSDDSKIPRASILFLTPIIYIYRCIALQEGIPMTPTRSLAASAASALPPLWVDDVDAVNRLLSDITRLMGILNSMHATRVGTVFGRDLDDMEVKIENMTGDITDKFRQAEKALMRVGAATRRVGGEEATIGANVQRR